MCVTLKMKEKKKYTSREILLKTDENTLLYVAKFMFKIKSIRSFVIVVVTSFPLLFLFYV